MPRYILHVNPVDLRKGSPAMILRGGPTVQRSRSWTIHCPQCGAPAATLAQRTAPASFGARAWVETEGEVTND